MIDVDSVATVVSSNFQIYAQRKEYTEQSHSFLRTIFYPALSSKIQKQVGHTKLAGRCHITMEVGLVDRFTHVSTTVQDPSH